jgi:hypothetical protein
MTSNNLQGGTTSHHRISLNTGFNVAYTLPSKVSQLTSPRKKL